MKISNKPVEGWQSTVGRKSNKLTITGLVMAGMLTLLVGASQADDKKPLTVKDVSDLVEAAQLAALDAQMDLRMEMKDSLSGQTQNYEGKVFTKSPGKVYVHYTKPEEQFLYVGDQGSQMYQPSEKMVYVQKAAKGKDAKPVYLGVGQELKRYIDISKVKIASENGDEVVLDFTPLDKDQSGFDRMKVTIRKKDWWPTQVEISTPAMVNKARFNQIVINKGLKDDIFDFTPPKGTQVVEGDIFQ
jgi:outer membrane lipoprotein-sorting protein